MTAQPEWHEFDGKRVHKNDLRIWELMKQAGVENSLSVYQAMKQLQMETLVSRQRLQDYTWDERVGVLAQEITPETIDVAMREFEAIAPNRLRYVEREMWHLRDRLAMMYAIGAAVKYIRSINPKFFSPRGK